MWIDNDFAQLNRQQLLRPAFDDGQIRSPSRRSELIREWLSALEASDLLTGYDHNVLRQWEDSGWAGSRPRLSFEINASYAEQEILREQERVAGLARQQQRLYDEWLRDASRRQAAEQEQALLRQYPISYREHLQRVQEAGEAEKRRRAEEIRQQIERQLHEKAEEEEREKLRLELQAENDALHERAMRYIRSPLDTTFDLSEGEFMHWCEFIATPEQVDQMTTALDTAGRYLRAPKWQRWLHSLARPQREVAL